MFLHRLTTFVIALALAISPTLRVQDHVYFGHEIKFHCYATVPVDRDNREIGVQWSGDEGEGYTSRQLDEYTDHASHYFEFRLRPGSYQIRAVLKRAGGQLSYSAAQTVEVRSDLPQDGN